MVNRSRVVIIRTPKKKEEKKVIVRKGGRRAGNLESGPGITVTAPAGSTPTVATIKESVVSDVQRATPQQESTTGGNSVTFSQIVEANKQQTVRQLTPDRNTVTFKKILEETVRPRLTQKQIQPAPRPDTIQEVLTRQIAKTESKFGKEDPRTVGLKTATFAAAPVIGLADVIINPVSTGKAAFEFAKSPFSSTKAAASSVGEGLRKGDPFALSAIASPVAVVKTPGLIESAARKISVRRVSSKAQEGVVTKTVRTVETVPEEKIGVALNRGGISTRTIPGFKVVKDVTEIEGGVKVGGKNVKILGTGTRVTKVTGEKLDTTGTTTIAVVSKQGDIIGSGGEVVKGVGKLTEKEARVATTGQQVRKVFEKGTKITSPDFIDAKSAVKLQNIASIQVGTKVSEDITQVRSRTGLLGSDLSTQKVIRGRSRQVIGSELTVNEAKVQTLFGAGFGGVSTKGSDAIKQFKLLEGGKPGKFTDLPKGPFDFKLKGGKSKRFDYLRQPPFKGKKGQLSLGRSQSIERRVGRPEIPVEIGGGKLAGEILKDIAEELFQPPKGRFAPGLGIKGGSITTTKSALQPNLTSKGQLKNFQVGKQNIITDFGFNVGKVPKITPDLKITPGLQIIPATGLIPKQGTSLITGPKVPGSPIVPTGIIGTPGGGIGGGLVIPPLGGGSSAIGVSKKGKKESFKFQPSLVAITFNIKGKAKKGPLTGLETRPIPI